MDKLLAYMDQLIKINSLWIFAIVFSSVLLLDKELGKHRINSMYELHRWFRNGFIMCMMSLSPSGHCRNAAFNRLRFASRSVLDSIFYVTHRPEFLIYDL